MYKVSDGLMQLLLRNLEDQANEKAMKVRKVSKELNDINAIKQALSQCEPDRVEFSINAKDIEKPKFPKDRQIHVSGMSKKAK